MPSEEDASATELVRFGLGGGPLRGGAVDRCGEARGADGDTVGRVGSERCGTITRLVEAGTDANTLGFATLNESAADALSANPFSPEVRWIAGCSLGGERRTAPCSLEGLRGILGTTESRSTAPPCIAPPSSSSPPPSEGIPRSIGLNRYDCLANDGVITTRRIELCVTASVMLPSLARNTGFTGVEGRGASDPPCCSSAAYSFSVSPSRAMIIDSLEDRITGLLGDACGPAPSPPLGEGGPASRHPSILSLNGGAVLSHPHTACPE